jgi:ADP-ribose pyrophosphatase YjhB (NUDIX family)
MHQVQKILLKRLSQQNNQRYSTLTRDYDYEDNIVFHLKKLIADGFLIKDKDLYSINSSGLKEVYSYELDTLADVGDKRYFVGLLIKDEQDNYLIKSHPVAKENFFNLPSGWPQFGESMDEAMTRIVRKNIGIDIDPSSLNFVSLHSKMIKTSTNEVLFDEGFAIFQIVLTDAQKKSTKLLTNLSWLSVDEIKSLPRRWPELDLCILNHPKPYESYEFISDYKL